MNKKVIAVVVAWNRAALLTQVLQRLAGQSRKLDGIVVVDNASTDDTATVIRACRAVSDTVTMPENLGGAGGFTAGIARALRLGADYIWVMDDDTLPYPDTLEILLTQWEQLAALTAATKPRGRHDSKPVLLAPRADWIDGREHPMNKPRVLPFASSVLVRRAQKFNAYPVRTCSFVGPLICAQRIRETGLPVADYFLWNDDFEYTARLLRQHSGFYTAAARVEHRTKTFGNSAASPGERFFREVRNKIWMYRFSKSLSFPEKILYGGKTLLRWITLLFRSKDRLALIKYLVQGVKASLKPPRSNTKIFENTPVLGDVIVAERISRESV